MTINADPNSCQLSVKPSNAMCINHLILNDVLSALSEFYQEGVDVYKEKTAKVCQILLKCHLEQMCPSHEHYYLILVIITLQ